MKKKLAEKKDEEAAKGEDGKGVDVLAIEVADNFNIDDI